MDPDAGDQLVGNDRFRDIIDAAAFEAFDDMLGVRKASHEDDWYVTEVADFPYPAASLEAIHLGHNGIHQNEIRLDLRDHGKSARAAAYYQYRHSCVFEHIGQQAQGLRRVVDRKNCGPRFGLRHHGTPALRGCPCNRRGRNLRRAAADRPGWGRPWAERRRSRPAWPESRGYGRSHPIGSIAQDRL